MAQWLGEAVLKHHKKEKLIETSVLVMVRAGILEEGTFQLDLESLHNTHHTLNRVRVVVSIPDKRMRHQGSRSQHGHQRPSR